MFDGLWKVVSSRRPSDREVGKHIGEHVLAALSVGLAILLLFFVDRGDDESEEVVVLFDDDTNGLYGTFSHKLDADLSETTGRFVGLGVDRPDQVRFCRYRGAASARVRAIPIGLADVMKHQRRYSQSVGGTIVAALTEAPPLRDLLDPLKAVEHGAHFLSAVFVDPVHARERVDGNYTDCTPRDEVPQLANPLGLIESKPGPVRDEQMDVSKYDAESIRDATESIVQLRKAMFLFDKQNWNRLRGRAPTEHGLAGRQRHEHPQRDPGLGFLRLPQNLVLLARGQNPWNQVVRGVVLITTEIGGVPNPRAVIFRHKEGRWW
ncbi:MAG TPA: hypothetical protein VGY54_16475 [Polyangiaceae bacterium]|jgi:hypothetical protein|nr:hypothetical protein [Polyangiaceae bacterium]